MAPNPWFPFVKPGAGSALRLFALPYAGGGATVYQSWRGRLPGGVELWAVQLPGHETRLNEPLIGHLPTLTGALVEAMRPFLDRPFVLFGHSMGAMLAFELARALRRASLPAPAHLLVSGCEPPPRTPPGPPLHTRPDAELIAHLRKLDGTAPELLAAAEYLSLLLPVFRKDLELAETDLCEPEPPLAVPITAFGGLEDSMPREVLERWREHTVRFGGARLLPGGHFFLNTHRELLLAALSEVLAPLLRG